MLPVSAVPMTIAVVIRVMLRAPVSFVFSVMLLMPGQRRDCEQCGAQRCCKSKRSFSHDYLRGVIQ
jgi:predicted metal-binding protein